MSDINYEAHPEYARYGNWEDLAAAQKKEIERLRGLLDSSRPFVAFHTIELRELLEHPLPPTALPGAIEAVKLRITELEKLEADIEQALDKRHCE